ncbi:CCA tRNA nucleotidyltransferase [Brevibacillus migulae]|uniref:CCA tRNA nucleotidyltransferase n=1 Tax=Brevibacillus migulae TaxID=1644114 RepID=UPI00106EFF90|nr:CCA tRNA nucleotidyltransferase [Brevibacillus migulae]
MRKEAARQVLQTLEENGYEAYFVGGCVRDWHLGRPIQDIDICTNAHPGDVMRLFPDHVPTGLKHGTVSVKRDGYLFEVTTYRTEGDYLDFRRPEHVTFVGELHLDLARRDFTMNAMAMDQHDRLEDPFHGRQDLADGVIRAVGDPSVRFREDALRILRAVRFSVQLGFQIEPETKAAIAETANLLAHIAIERVRDELNKLLHGSFLKIGMETMVETRLFQGIPLLHHLFGKPEPQIWRIGKVETLTQKWSLLFYMMNLSPIKAKELCFFLKMSKREIETIGRNVIVLDRLQPKWDTPAAMPWDRLLLEYGLTACEEIEGLLRACWWNHEERDTLSVLRKTYDALPVKTTKELAINGKQLQEALQKKQGDWIAHTLNHLLVQTALHGLPNTPERLLEEARNEVARYEKHQA